VVERINYIVEQAREQLKEFPQLILVGASAPVSYFAHPTKNSVPTSPGCQIFALTIPGEDYIGALAALETALSLRGTELIVEKKGHLAAPPGEFTLPGFVAARGAFLPENAIVVVESITSGRSIMPAT